MAKFQKSPVVYPMEINAEGAPSFSIQNPAVELLSTVGSAFFNENSLFYNTNQKGTTKAKTEDLTDQSANIIALAEKVCETETPQDLLAIAYWARTEGKLRTTPCVLLAVAAHAAYLKNSGLVRKYCNHIIRRVDDINQVFLAYLQLYGRPLPNALKRGLANAFLNFDEYGFLKYQEGLGNVLKMIDRAKNYPVSDAIREFLVEGTVSNPEKVPMIWARKQLSIRTELDTETKALVKSSGATWENVVSQFGSKKEVWETVVPNMPYFALLRNLSNFCKVGLDPDIAKVIATKISNPEKVKESGILPFQFYAAHKELSAENGSAFIRSEFLGAVSKALDISVKNLSILPGKTVAIIDVSSSMDGARPSQKSSVTAAEIGNLMGALTFSLSENGAVIRFASLARLTALVKGASVISNLERLMASSFCGGSTEAFRAVDLMIEQDIRADRIILLSDMQCYGNDRDLQVSFSESIRKYRSKINPNLWVHSVDLVGYMKGTQVPEKDPRVNLISGWSEKIFDLVASAEGLVEGKKIPSLDYIRKNF